VPDVVPRNIKPLYRRGNLIIWDQEGTDLGRLRSDADADIGSTHASGRPDPSFLLAERQLADRLGT
jgi:hypothetical protein